MCLGCTFYSTNDEYSATDTESGNLYIPLKEDHQVNEIVHTMNVYPRSVYQPSVKLSFLSLN